MLTDDDKEFFASMMQPQQSRKDFKILGLRLGELSVIGSVIVGLVLFFSQTRSFIEEQRDFNNYVRGFMRNSDSYHAAVIGIDFEQGRPAGANGEVIKEVRNIIRPNSNGGQNVQT